MPEDDLGSRLTGVADLGERAAQPPPAGVRRRRGRRRVAWITAIALAVVLAIALAGLAVRARVGLDQVAVNPSAGSIPLPLVSDLGPIVGIQLLDATSGWALTAGRLVWTDTGGASWPTITPGRSRRVGPRFGLWTAARRGSGRRWVRRASSRARTEPAR